jgi:hypothetical protein
LFKKEKNPLELRETPLAVLINDSSIFCPLCAEVSKKTFILFFAANSSPSTF